MASAHLSSAMNKADELHLGERDDSRRAYQQMNNAQVRIDAAIDELAI